MNLANEPRRLAIITAILAIIPLLGWWTYGLFDVDEGFYAAVVAEMNRRGEWVTPYYNGSPWFEKPILLYWMAKPTIAAFGDMVGPRLPSILCALALYGLVWTYVRRWLGTAAAFASTMVLATSFLFVAVNRMMMTDPPMVLFFSAAMLTFWDSLNGNPKMRLWTAAFLGVAVLAKGPVALILFALIAIPLFFRPNLRPNFKGYWLEGTLILFAVIASWYLPAYLANGSTFVDEFMIEQNVGRFTGGDEAHTLTSPAHFVLYIPILLLGMLPWSLYIPRAWPRKGFKFRSDLSLEQEDLRSFLAVWALVVFVFFSISSAKLPHYIHPVYVPLAILVGDDLARRWKGEIGWGRVARWAVGSVVLWGVVQWGFTTYYYGGTVFGQKLPGFHAEVHRLTRYVKSQGGDVAVYSMSRLNKDLGTGKPKIQETSHPSLLLYLDDTVLDTKEFEDIAKHPGRIWIVTRWNRIQAQDYTTAGAHGRSLAQVRTPFEQDLYHLYVLE